MDYNAFPPKICCPAAANLQQQTSGNCPKVDIIVMSNDISSHVDSCAHFVSDGRTISDLTGSELFAPAVIIDISSRVPANCETNRASNIDMFNVTVTVQDLEKWEVENGREIPRGAIVAMRSGWSELFNCGREYNNFDRDGVCHFPGFSIEAANWLLEKRFISGLAVDTLSVDVGSSSTFPVHKAVLGKSLFNVENLDLSSVPSSLGKNAHFIVAPLTVRNAPEAPCRCIVVEVLDE
jgi:kynurenine formamidase